MAQMCAAAGLLFWLSFIASAAPPVAQEFALANGLRVIVQADHRAPVVVFQVWYKVGASYELDGATGVSHALEHMMFKRTKGLASGEFSRLVADHGGRENAFTTADFTTYYQQWSADQVALSMKLEAERMRNLRLDPAEFKNEIKVIREERRLRTDDNATALALETVLAHTWQTSPYRQPVIGWPADIEQMQLADLTAWYRRYYVPNNAILVVVGDVEVAAIKKLANRYFGGIPRQQIPLLHSRPEQPQRGEKRLTIASNKLRVPMLMMNYKVPGFSALGKGTSPPAEWEIYALDVLLATLDGGESARFARHLVRGQELALSAGASYQSTSRLEDLFSLTGTPREGHTLAELEAALKAEITAIEKTPPDAAELARIKTSVVAEAVYQQDSMMGQAMLIGSLAVIGLDWRIKDTYAARIQAVTPDQVKAVAAKYFQPDQATVAYVVPENNHE